ncbi:hypothetical protein CVS40_12857 [Lucilia cuprina]|nr:hypothetical protein CVS40_12857 [Lucilia cuprina]
MTSPDDQIDFLNENLHRKFENTVPLRTCRPIKTNFNWFNNTVKGLIKERNEVYARWKRFRTIELHDEYRR